MQTREEATVYVKELDLFVTVMLLEETPSVLSLGKLCEDHVVYLPLGQWSKTTFQRNNCKKANYVPFVVPGLSTSSSASSTPTSSASSSQDSVFDVGRYTENPATERSEIMSEESRGNRHMDQQKIENTNQNEDDEESRCALLQDLP